MEVTVKKIDGKLVGEIELQNVEASEGDTLVLVHVGDRLDFVPKHVAEELEVAKNVMVRRREVLRELAK